MTREVNKMTKEAQKNRKDLHAVMTYTGAMLHIENAIESLDALDEAESVEELNNLLEYLRKRVIPSSKSLLSTLGLTWKDL